MPVVKKSFLGGINNDDATYLLDPKDYLGALNVRIVTSEKGEVGKVMPIESNILRNRTTDKAGTVIDFELPLGTNQVIGAAEDTPKRRIIWCVWNSNGNHGIYCYDGDKNLIYTVLKSSDVTGGLNFQQDKFIHSCSVVYGLFYWTDDYNNPRRINIDAGIITNHDMYVTDEAKYSLPIAQSVISVIRAQPTYPITLAYGFDGTHPNNTKLDTSGYQASYRFGYRDGEVSTFSIFSKASEIYAGQDTYLRPIIYSYITFTIPFGQKIAQDVDKIEIAVKNPGSKMFVQKTWTREHDAAAIANHNAGITALSFNFYSNSIGVAVDDAATFKAYDNVPLLAKTMEVAKDRLFFANTLTGYDSPKDLPMGFGVGLGAGVSIPASGTKVWYSGSTYKFGVVYYDEFGRSCGVVAGPSLTIPNMLSNFYPTINWSLTNTSDPIPMWAKSFSIVMTKSKKASSFLQFVSSDFKYVTRDAAGAFAFNPTPPASIGDIYGLAVKASSLYSFGYGYQYTEGDILSLGVSTNLYNLRVINQYSDYIIFEYNSSVTSASVVEVYTPVPTGGVEYYYEVGYKFDILNPGTSIRSYSITSGSLDGDVYVKQRVIGTVTYYLEVMNMIDSNWTLWDTDAGRGMTEIFNKVERQVTNICFSEPFTVGVNGMSTFNALDYSILPSELGNVQKIITNSKAESQGTMMLIIGEQETAVQYIGESQVFDNTGSSFLAKSSGVLGNMNVLRGSFGTLHPESVFHWKGEVIFFDVNKGAIVKFSTDGLSLISDIKLRKYWKTVAQDIRDYYRDPAEYESYNPDLPMRVLGMIEPYNDEILIYTPQMGSVPDDMVIVDVLSNCNSYDYQFPEGDDHVALPLTLTPGKAYHIDTLWRETSIEYNGQVYDPEAGGYFIAVPGVDEIVIYSDTQFSGTVTVCECMTSPYSMYDGFGGTIAFSNLANRWTSKYSFNPEWMGNVNNRLITFKNGMPYIHDGTWGKGNKYNRFYGMLYDTWISSVHVEDGNTIKVYTNAAIEGDTPDMMHFRTEVPYVQSTNIMKSEFIVKEGVSYAPILRDRLSPNATGDYDQKMMKGDKMRGEVIKFMVLYEKPWENGKQLKFANLHFDPSFGQTV